MEVNNISPIDPNVDFEKILPIQQKRIIAFINHFLTTTVSFLNTFVQSCESRLMEFEYKLQKVDASLLILESQLSSISSLNDTKNIAEPQTSVQQINLSQDLPEVIADDTKKEDVYLDAPRACEDTRFARFFKMVQFGVPPPAVKLKMVAEGVDPSVLDKPNDVIPGYIIETKPHSSSSSSS